MSQFDKNSYATNLKKTGGGGPSGAPATVAGWPSQTIRDIGDAAPYLYRRIAASCEKFAEAITSHDEPLRAEAQTEIDAIVLEGAPALLIKNATRFHGRSAMVDLNASRAGR